MDTIIIVLKVGLILYGIYSFIVYMSRRSDNRSALKDFRNAPVLRRITDEEKSALQPFLMGQKLTVDDNVRELSGVFLRHGLSTQGSSTEHDTIGDVDVLLPYDAIDYIEPHNQALVVLAGKCAVVIRLNGFDLLEGRQRAQRQQAQDQQWKRGEIGALPSLDEAGADTGAAVPEAVAASIATDPNARYQRGEVDILSQRTETPEEIESRVGRGGWASAFAWLLAFVLLWVATWDATQAVSVYLMGAGLLAGLWAAWLFVCKPPATAQVRQPQPVNRVRGMLNQIAVVNAGNASVQNVGLFIGDKLSLVLPSHWRTTASVPYGEVIEAELRTSDFSAVSFGDKWSVADEWRRFRPAYWGRHLLHLVVGLLAIGAVALSAPDPRGEAALAAQWLTNGGTAAIYGEAGQLADKPPRWGSRARMEGEGRCEIDMSGRAEEHHSGVPAIDCSFVRWNGTAPVIPALDIPPSVLALAEPGFLRATENHAMASLIAMLRMQQMGGQASDPLAAYRARESVPLTVRGFDRSVAMIDAACKDAAGLSPAACERLQRELMRAIDATVDKDGVETPVNTWQALATSAAAGKENADLVLSRQQLASVQRALAQAVDSVVATKIEAALPAIVPAQGGVLLASPTRIGNARVQAPGEGSDDVSAAGAPVADVAEDDTDSSLLARWTRLQRNATAEGLKPFTLEGLVTASGKDTTGTPWVRVDQSLDASRMTAAGAHVLWWLFAAGLVLVNGVLFALRWTQGSRRRARLEADIATRPAPGTSGLF
ncbi:hypothetical protein J2W25_001040 [Variovorax boronicumulans]|uniref:Intracellular growth attenuator igaA n=1 Tax=Variovorax boronicumulans TaxID=436515 RepID=A0AAW8DRL3_9BURK|nr:IgaA/UmoB family intracellular growth attenuator [Variovorax boronicumulans]MDP9877098.1 hypothetical protein [Variovorax boronicumulans]MDP9922025.1 hypothetical protein [Variovorax boronicumulans]